MKFVCDTCGYESYKRTRYRRCPTRRYDCNGMLKTHVFLNREDWMIIEDLEEESVLFWRGTGNSNGN